VAQVVVASTSTEMNVIDMLMLRFWKWNFTIRSCRKKYPQGQDESAAVYFVRGVLSHLVAGGEPVSLMSVDDMDEAAIRCGCEPTSGVLFRHVIARCKLMAGMQPDVCREKVATIIHVRMMRNGQLQDVAFSAVFAANDACVTLALMPVE
jgi:hypothetical protein